MDNVHISFIDIVALQEIFEDEKGIMLGRNIDIHQTERNWGPAYRAKALWPPKLTATETGSQANTLSSTHFNQTSFIFLFSIPFLNKVHSVQNQVRKFY